MKTRLRESMAALLCCASVSAHAASPARSTEFQITGTLLESACYLDPSSAYQTLSLGELSTARLSHIGDQGTPVALHLKLQGCVRSHGGRHDEQQGPLVWSAIEPVAAVAFKAVADADTPGLIKVVGAEGFGLRLLDVQGNDVRLGRTAPAWFVSPGSSQLTYYIRPERTAAPLRPGAFRASLNVNLAYD
ncbi:MULTISPECIES: fimbrial protein [Pseudomonas chlororaphis group]|uniref:fimbrial protein n=1 Tax=Pseudomonas chlororaphis group TaxID=136842 RepID=UPI00209857FD|nr:MULTISPECIES: fimbrial protein [Pseudomonas chlororaphis group]MCO7580386.1 type 1 fimbrial protein [Pseudomonas protegens]MCO7586497.1 type 1 fimbrial protein [Pseudomonas chlororaphis]MCO7603530.1 type 1 fimbrial protein [Pseudomonas chlororaphis]